MNRSNTDPSPVSQGPGAVALLERRAGMSSDLFSRYWRDVHGVLATRIPGFKAYRQYHMDRVPLYRGSEATPAMAIDGIAEVLFAEAKSDGLVGSRVAELIRSDEQNVFSRTLLYSLPGGASQVGCAETHDPNEHLQPASVQSRALFLLLQKTTADLSAESLWGHLSELMQGVSGVRLLQSHLLSAGDMSWWNTPGVDNRAGSAPFQAAVKLECDAGGGSSAHVDSLIAALRRPSGSPIRAATLYKVTQRFIMVDDGEPTEIGLRGLDAVRTIGEANATNQRSAELLRCLFKYP